jgi:hypothetical protein
VIGSWESGQTFCGLAERATQAHNGRNMGQSTAKTLLCSLAEKRVFTASGGMQASGRQKLRERDGPHREGEEPKPMMYGHEQISVTRKEFL